MSRRDAVAQRKNTTKTTSSASQPLSVSASQRETRPIPAHEFGPLILSDRGSPRRGEAGTSRRNNESQVPIGGSCRVLSFASERLFFFLARKQYPVRFAATPANCNLQLCVTACDFCSRALFSAVGLRFLPGGVQVRGLLAGRMRPADVTSRRSGWPD